MTSQSCPWCPAKFNNESEWYNHVRNEPELYMPLKCPNCSFEGYCVRDLKRHILKESCEVARSKKNKERIQCEYCKKLYTNMSGKKKHIRYRCPVYRFKRAPPVACEYCNRVYVDENGKRKHIRYHCEVYRAKIKNIASFITDDGSQLFNQQQALELDCVKLDI